MRAQESTEHATFFATSRAFRDSRCVSKDALTKKIFGTLRIKDPKQYTAILMPSMYGPEVRWLLGAGVPRKNLFAVERNPMVHAALKIPTTRKPMPVLSALDHVPFDRASLVYLDFFGPPNGKHLLAFQRLFRLGLIQKGSRLLVTLGVNRGEMFSNNLNKRLNAESVGQAYIEAAHMRSSTVPIRSVINHSYTTATEFHSANFVTTEVRF